MIRCDGEEVGDGNTRQVQEGEVQVYENDGLMTNAGED